VHLTVITVLRSGQHLSHWQEVETESIEEVTEGPLARHVADRVRWHPDIDRFIVIAGALSWKIDISLGQHALYRLHRQLAANAKSQ
jgi:hypothetical protein